MKKLMKRGRYTFLLLFGIGSLFFHFWVPRVIVEIRNPLIETFKKNYSATPSEPYEDQNYSGKKITFYSNDSLELKAYLTYSKRDTARGTIILLHGIRSYKEHFIPISKRLAEHGFNTVALDLRAHGESEGTFCTFGYHEKYDIHNLIDYLQDEIQLQNIGIWGQSLGGAVALQSMAIDKRIEFGIIESTFSNLTQTTQDYANYHTGFNIKFLIDYLLYRSGKIANFEPNDVQPRAYCSKITQPVLIVHGTKDKRISIKYGKENFNKIISPQKKFLAITGATHLNVWKVGGEQYMNTVLHFIKKQVNL